MDSIIVSAILSGVGPVCPECLSRGHVPALRLPPEEVYSFGLTDPPAQLDWDIHAARALIAARPRVAHRLDSEWLKIWLAQRTVVTAKHLDHIPADRLDEPAIVVEILASPPSSEPRPFRILIDGTHRAARKLRLGQDYWAYLLTEPEQSSICTYRVGGQVVDVPTFPGSGIGDADAGIYHASTLSPDRA